MMRNAPVHTSTRLCGHEPYAIRRTRYRLRSGMTLVELLIVLVIIGLLSGISLRAIEVTRERANYVRTTTTMTRLIHAISGNPELISEGRRTDFGFVGDMGRLPVSLEELRTNITTSPAWNGPYVRIPFTGDELSFKTDGWGQELQYLPDQGAIISLGNGKFPITMPVTDDTSFLMRNAVTGTVTDNEGNPPGEQAANVHVRIWVTDPTTGQPMYYDTTVGTDGSYAFRSPQARIPVGNHQVTVVRNGVDSLVKWVTVVPRVGAIVDFRFGTTIVGRLKLLTGSVASLPGDSTNDNLVFEVINTGDVVVRVDTIMFVHCADSAYCDSLTFAGVTRWYSSGIRKGVNDTIGFFAPDSVLPLARARIYMLRFRKQPDGSGGAVDLRGKPFHLKFDDGSMIDFIP